MLTRPLISIIVPVYNVERYVKTCIDSILEQTYNNLEIIIVDDGSTDNSGIICDAYCRIDKRVKVIHQANQGLSAARNTGIDNSHGDYIGFVDSDDFIHPEMYSKLFDDISRHQVLLSFCQFKRFKDIDIVDIVDPILQTDVLSAHDVIFQSLALEKWWEACTKLFHKSLFSTLRFPDGRINEDYAIMMNVYHLCDRICINRNPLYYYRVRKGSITMSPLSVKSFDQIQNSEEVLSFIRENYPDCEKPASAILLTAGQGLLSRIYNGNYSEFKDKEQHIFQVIHNQFPSFLRNHFISPTQRLFLFAANIHPSLFKLLNKLYHFIKS